MRERHEGLVDGVGQRGFPAISLLIEGVEASTEIGRDDAAFICALDKFFFEKVDGRGGAGHMK